MTFQADAPSQQACEPVFVARQPIFTPQRMIWAYELLFRSSSVCTTAEFPDADQATQQVIADGYTLARTGINPTTKAFINFPRNLLLEETAFALPPETSVIEVLETVEPEPAILGRLQTLKKNGYIIALDDFVGQPGYEPLLELADIIKVDILGMTTEQIEKIVEELKPYPGKLLAEKVEDIEIFEATKSMGFDLFQGFFFSKPEIIPGYKLSSNQQSRLRLLKELSTEDFELPALSEIVQSDVSISYRLMQYINSTHFSTRIKVESISRALGLLGRRNIQQWLRVTVMADLNKTDSGRELMWLSICRGRFLQLMAEHATTTFPANSMFILGLFSLLDALLGQPMETILKNIPLDEELKKYIIDPEGTGCVWIKFLRAQERGEWETSNAILESQNIDLSVAADLNIQAQNWASEMLQGQGE